MTLDEFRVDGVTFADLSFLASVAVGFRVSVYRVLGRGGRRYRVTSRDDVPVTGPEFWEYYAKHVERGAATPEAAAAEFVAAYLEWRERHPDAPGRWGPRPRIEPAPSESQ